MASTPEYPPIGNFALASTGEMTNLSTFKGKPTVIHLYTSWGGCWPTSSRMERWAGSKEYKDRVNFICVSCAGPQVASSMSNESKFDHATNGIITRQIDMPRWGQLGCNGLIILNAEHRVVLPKSSAFLEVQGLAFKHVESVLDAILAGKEIPSVGPGQYVQIHSLTSKTELNSKVGIVKEAPNEAGRVLVALLSNGRQVLIHPKNLAPRDADGSYKPTKAESDVDEGSSSGGGWHTGDCAKVCSSPPQEEAIPFLKSVPSVLNDDLDHEHEECIDALNQFAKERTLKSLKNCFNVLKDHFDSEEKVLDQTLYAGVSSSGGASASGFSVDANMRKSHYADHKRMLDILRSGMEMPSGKKFPLDLVTLLMQNFLTHADKYDGSYAERLQQALLEQKS